MFNFLTTKIDKKLIELKNYTKTNSEGKATIEFYTAESSATYSAVIEGVTDDGKLIYRRADAFNC